MKQLLEQSAQLLSQTQLPHRLLLVLSDFARPTFADVQLFSPLKSPATRVPDLQVVFMPQSQSATTPDLAIAHFTLASGRPVVGSEVTFEAQLLNNSDAAALPQLDLLMDDQPTATHPRVQLSSSTNSQGSAVLKIPFRLPSAGPHRFTLRLQDQNDALAWDNQRELCLTVADQIKVLLVGAQDRIRPRSTAYYLNAALNPFAAPAPGTPNWSISPTYRSTTRLATERLDIYSAIFFCDVPTISAAMADALAAYVQSGHRLIFFLGPSISAADYNTQLAGNLHLLPSPLASPLFSAKGSTVNWVDPNAEVFANLFDSEEPYRSIVVTGRWTFAAAPHIGRPIAELTDDAPLITEHPLGRGEVFTILTVPTTDWSTLATTVPFLPMINRMALGTPAQSAAETSFETGQEVELPIPPEAGASAVDVLTPTGETINLAAANPPNNHWLFTHTFTDGLYRWQTIKAGTKTGEQGQFVVNPPAQEADLLMADTQLLARDSSISHPTLIAPTTADLFTQLNQQAQPTSLAPGILTLAALLLIAEALLANRHTPAHSPTTLGVPPLGGVRS